MLRDYAIETHLAHEAKVDEEDRVHSEKERVTRRRQAMETVRRELAEWLEVNPDAIIEEHDTYVVVDNVKLTPAHGWGLRLAYPCPHCKEEIWSERFSGMPALGEMLLEPIEGFGDYGPFHHCPTLKEAEPQPDVVEPEEVFVSSAHMIENALREIVRNELHKHFQAEM